MIGEEIRSFFDVRSLHHLGHELQDLEKLHLLVLRQFDELLAKAVAQKRRSLGGQNWGDVSS